MVWPVSVDSVGPSHVPVTPGPGPSSPPSVTRRRSRAATWTRRRLCLFILTTFAPFGVGGREVVHPGSTRVSCRVPFRTSVSQERRSDR